MLVSVSTCPKKIDVSKGLKLQIEQLGKTKDKNKNKPKNKKLKKPPTFLFVPIRDISSYVLESTRV